MLRYIAGLAVALLSATAAQAQAPDMSLPKHAPYPGGIAVVKIGEADAQVSEVTLNGKRVLTLRQAGGLYALAGIAIETPPGKQELQVKAGEGVLKIAYTTAFEVQPKAYAAQHLKVDQRFRQLSAQDQARVDRESPIIIRAREHWSDSLPAEFALDLPASGRLSARYGLRRVYNGKEGWPHLGLDVAVGTGTPIRAAARGRVVGVGDFFYAGQSVFVDHGQGFITLYIHLSRIDVKEGDAVERGAQLGLSGATGQVTGPHLHWGVLLNGVYVDPELFLRPAQR